MSAQKQPNRKIHALLNSLILVFLLNLLSMGELRAILTSLEVLSLALGPKMYRGKLSANTATRLYGTTVVRPMIRSKKKTVLFSY